MRVFIILSRLTLVVQVCALISPSFSATLGLSTSDSLKIDQYIQRAEQAYKEKGDYAAALATFDSALTAAEELKSEEGVLRVLINASILRHILNDYDIALELLFRAEQICERRQNQQEMAEVSNNIGAIYHTQREFMKAADYYNRSLDIYQELQRQEEIGRAYNNFGVLWQDRNEPLTAIEYHRRSIAIWQAQQDKGWLGVSNMHMGVCHKLMNNLDSAIYFLSKSAKTIEALKERRILSLVYAELGKVYMQSGQNELAAKWCKKGFDLSSEMGIINFQRKNCQCLYEAHENMGNQGDALNFHKLYAAFRDSAHNEEKAKEMTRIEMDYAFARQQFADSVKRNQQQVVLDLKHQEELANERADRNVAMAIGIGIFLLAGGLWSRLRYVRRSQRAIQKERERSDELLLNILPEAVAAELKEKGSAEAKLLDDVTVLFTDFKGFTRMSEQMTPKALVKDLHECFSAFDRICEKYGIEKIKTIGDAYMAAGGLPSPSEDHAEKVIQAALEMRDFVETGKQFKIANNLPYFEIRIGVHTGPVVAGIVGVKKFQYDIWGDTVNTASRMESSGKVGKVNISETTYEFIKDQFTCEYRGEVEAKGKGKLKMYFASGG